MYAIVLKWPQNNQLSLGAPSATENTKISMLGYEGAFNFKSLGTKGIKIVVPDIPAFKMPSMDAWVFKLNGLKDRMSHTNSNKVPKFAFKVVN